jgi:methyl-accepting chemotaxis protein
MNENSISTYDAQASGAANGHVKRNQMYVKRQFQQSMLLQALLITFIIVNTMVMTIFWAMDYFADLQQMKVYVACTIAALEIIGFFFLYRLNLKASHRIAGPIYSLERCLQRIEAGDLTGTLRLREDDNFPETAEQLNATVKTVRSRINQAQYLAAQIRLHPEQSEQLSEKLIKELAFFNTTKIDEAQ